MHQRNPVIILESNTAIQPRIVVGALSTLAGRCCSFRSNFSCDRMVDAANSFRVRYHERLRVLTQGVNEKIYRQHLNAAILFWRGQRRRRAVVERA